MITNDHITIQEIQADFEVQTRKLEAEVINNIVDKSGIEDRIKQQVVGLLGARLLENRSGSFEVNYDPQTLSHAVIIKFKYE